MEKDKDNIVNELKKIEAANKKALLIKVLEILKDYAKIVLINKTKTKELLNYMDLSEKDKKSIIDWINNLPNVKLSKDDIKGIKEETIQLMNIEKEKVQKKIIENPEKYIFNDKHNDYCPFTDTTTTTSNINTSCINDLVLIDSCITIPSDSLISNNSTYIKC